MEKHDECKIERKNDRVQIDLIIIIWVQNGVQYEVRIRFLWPLLLFQIDPNLQFYVRELLQTRESRRCYSLLRIL